MDPEGFEDRAEGRLVHASHRRVDRARRGTAERHQCADFKILRLGGNRLPTGCVYGVRRPDAGCEEEVAVPALLGATVDPHLDVRKAAVIALAGWTCRPDVRDALEAATKDSDADVRGYARRQLARRL